MNPHQTGSQPTTASVAVLTISDTRTVENDTSGNMIRESLDRFNHTCVASAIVKDKYDAILSQADRWIADNAIDAIITTGGTGVAKRDVTVDTLRPAMTLELIGFGELFRMLSYKEVGSIAMLSRATAGLAIRDDCETFIFLLPGSVNACQVAMEKLIGPELGHLLWERRK